MPYTELSQLRAARTRAASRVRSLVKHNVVADAPFKSSDGLPSWWPFWSDCLKDAVRDCVRAARKLEHV